MFLVCWEPGFRESPELESDGWVCAGGVSFFFLLTMRTPEVVAGP